MSVEKLRFPSGRTVKQLKQYAKRSKAHFQHHTDALQAQAKANGLDLPWDEAITLLKQHWSQWFAIGVYQEDAPWQIDVRLRGFSTEEEASLFARSFSGTLLWRGGDHPLVLQHRTTGEVIPLNNADVRLWRVKAASRHKLTIGMTDMERVHTPITQWPELFNTTRPTFGSLAYGVEYGDDDGAPGHEPEQLTDQRKQGLIELERIGLSMRAKQAGARLVQIRHPYDLSTNCYYIVTSEPLSMLTELIATLYYLAERLGPKSENGYYLPSYYSGGAVLTAHFVASVLSEVFNKTLIETEHFDYARLAYDENTSAVPAELEGQVDIVNLHRLMEEFTPDEHDVSHAQPAFFRHKEQVLTLYRRSQGLPEQINENAWQLQNINPNAIERPELPLVINDLTVDVAWCQRFDLEQKVFASLGMHLGLDRSDDFSDIYQHYTNVKETKHDYPIYRVCHPDFFFDAS